MLVWSIYLVSIIKYITMNNSNNSVKLPPICEQLHEFIPNNSNNSVKLPQIREQLCGSTPFVMRIFRIKGKIYVTLHDIHWCIHYLIKDPTKDIRELRENFETKRKPHCVCYNTDDLIKNYPHRKDNFGKFPKCTFISVEEIIDPSGHYFSFFTDRFIMRATKNAMCFANKSNNVSI